MSEAPLLSVEDLRVRFWTSRGLVHAVNGITFDVRPGETLGLVGESGCGKSTLGKTVMGIYTPTAGEIRFAGREIGRLPRRARRAVAKDLQYVYQDPGASLDPRWKIRPLLHEPLVIHTPMTRAEPIASCDADTCCNSLRKPSRLWRLSARLSY